jgi:plasmid maintenance system antidote protein VapI
MNKRTPLENALYRRRLTQTWLAQQLRMAQSGMSLIVRGQRRPTIDVALRISKLLDVPVQHLWRDEWR